MPKTRTMPATDAYFSRVRRFPLRRIKSKSEHAAALDHLNRVSLMHQDTKDAGVVDYLDTLAGLIDDYERRAALKLDVSAVKPADIVRHPIKSNGTTVTRLARQIGIGQRNLSEMLSGRRDFSKAAIARLCQRFGLNPSLFF